LEKEKKRKRGCKKSGVWPGKKKRRMGGEGLVPSMGCGNETRSIKGGPSWKRVRELKKETKKKGRARGSKVEVE